MTILIPGCDEAWGGNRDLDQETHRRSLERSVKDHRQFRSVAVGRPKLEAHIQAMVQAGEEKNGSKWSMT